MNSMMQQWFHVPAFRYSFLSYMDNDPPNWQPFEGELVDDNLIHQVRKLLGFLELSERQEYNPREFCFSFKDYSGQPTNVRLHQDTQEFLNRFFDKLDDHFKNTHRKYLLESIFGGETSRMRICKGCGFVR